MPRALLVVLLASALAPRGSLAAWPSTSTTNLAISNAASEQDFPWVVTDGNSGVIVTWKGGIVGSMGPYAQRVSFSGSVLWTANGAALVQDSTYDYYGAPAIPDGAGGAIATWMAWTGTKDDLYAQRISGAGVNQWGPNGAPICTGTGDHSDPVIVSDGAGGAIIAWRDHRGFNYDIYAQRVNAAGVAQWTTDGLPVCTANGEHESPDIISDGAGGAIVVWVDHRNTNLDVFAQRLNAAGSPQWTLDGVGVCTNTAHQLDPTLMTDGAGGAFVAWEDQRSGTYDVYAQRLNASGTSLWAPQGAPVCAAINNQIWPRMATDGAGGVIFAWTDRRTATDAIFAQRMNAAGTTQWLFNGVAVVSGGTATGRFIPRIVPDGAGGAIVAWQENPAADLLAQRLTSTGATAWAAGGVAVSNAAGSQSFLLHGGEGLNFTSMIADGTGGAIVAWEDTRNGPDDIYAQRIQHDGTLGGSVTGVGGPVERASFSIHPNPARGAVFFEIGPSGAPERVEVLDVTGRPLWSRSASAGAVRWNGETGAGRLARSGIYWARVTSAAGVSMQRFVWLR